VDDRPPARVVVATDGGPAARAAALQVARPPRRPLAVTLLTVLTDPPGEDAGGIEGPVATPEEEALEWEQAQREAREALRVTSWAFDHEGTSETDTTVDKRLEIGDAGHAICMVAEEIGADLIVMGMRGRGRIQALLFGSTAEHVIRHAKSPVLLAHDPED
jgi:nucleotide-binding universal stress UspA family protein